MEPVGLLQELVRLPSVNPAYPGVPAAEAGEARAARHLGQRLAAAGFRTELVEVLPGRPNLVARHDGPGPGIGLAAHLDTVPAGGMTVPPFAAELVDGAVQGRGAADTKGSAAAMAAAAAQVLAERGARAPAMTLLFTVDEETGFAGARHYAAAGAAGVAGFVVGEPTGNRLVTAHKGVLRTTIRAAGRAAHSSAPAAGVNAIYRLAAAVRALAAHAEALRAGPAHPRLGPPSLAVTTIRGGTAINTIPEAAAAGVDRRLLPEEEPAAALAAIRAAVAESEGVAVEEPSLAVSGFAIEEAHPWVRRVAAARPAGTGATVAYATDASILQAAGVPCVVCGPGEPALAHTADEALPVAALEAATAMLRRLLLAASE